MAVVTGSSSLDQLSALGKGQFCKCLEVQLLKMILDICKLVSGTVACNSVFNIGKPVQGMNSNPCVSSRKMS